LNEKFGVDGDYDYANYHLWEKINQVILDADEHDPDLMLADIAMEVKLQEIDEE
jgi:hypothetical protein